MSVGGGFKKGKAEFAMKDIDGRDIKTATESFRYDGEDKVLSVNGIDIDSTDNFYGLYFRYNGREYNIYTSDEDRLTFDGNCYFQDAVTFNGAIYDRDGVSTAGGVTSFGKLAYLSCDDQGAVIWSELYDVHCWQFRKGPVTLLIYIADWAGNSPTENLFTYLNSPIFDIEFNARANKIFNIHASFTSPYSGNYLVSYTIDRGPAESGGDGVSFNLTLIGRDSSGAMNVQTLSQEMTSNSYQSGEIKLLF